MDDPFQNLQSRTGHTMDEWMALVADSGREKHGEIVAWLKSTHGITHGFANGIALAFRSRGAPTSEEGLVDAQYSGAKAALRPVLERILALARDLGPDVDVAPKKTSVSLRRTTQFAVVEAASASRVKLGLQLRDHPTTDRLRSAAGMCSHTVDVRSVDDVDDEVLGWLRTAYDRN
ncbi:DUF5655 domain-containing protein [Phycicoccus sonneratiae]|uniref:DUF4287 domain-containing protein n=1 Tax=Phycicoccus sonneratiae TaxID=2807628 RepID=A0ABS2CIQ8_9MICO|nr:DUF5655 domain-containing protein [Phycicoccus sonneraticus]MBM6399749.1 DUF4287 domain-containing protein [Phycicoccus sonneraticus]